jgi:ribosomal protein S18 acetylase RimI-like enzyme
MSTIPERMYTTIRIPKTAPEAFSAELDSESRLPQSTWLSRITESNATILICVATRADTNEQSLLPGNRELRILLDGEWIGMFTVIGPVSRGDYIWPKSGQPEPGPEDSETRWQLTSLFTLPAYRGHGIAKRLTEAAIEFGKLASDELGRASNREIRTRVRLVVHPKNTGVIRMYEKFGFIDSARMTVAEACIANGAADMIPKDADPEKWHSRLGVAMEILV